ncbi:MAG: hypothetical protein ACTSYA_00910 [Candidatus Kariarchaeaceae archaeon]
MIKAIYLISIGGIPLYTKNLSESKDITEVTLFTGGISALQQFLVETDVGEAKSFKTKKSELFIETTPDYAVVLIKGLDDIYSTEEVMDLMACIVQKLSFTLTGMDDFGQITHQQEMEIDELISFQYSSWKKQVNQSKASRKLKDSLW